MIQEDYVSFEVAKPLKEKGFSERSYGAYNLQGEFQEGHGEWNKTSIYYAAPTHQMAMKWLREVHNIVINIGWGEVFEDKFQWWCIILSLKDGSILRESEYYATYEDAVEAALKYCLENLI